ncbi:hypothetical protein ACFV9E_39000 [Streptomyces sp. NPDC059835]|uniref:hypothetical protein n=1 Tax=Streptomyces sp. NPDC059835 TaxID=3346967 RepID=UPI003646CA49
MTFDILNSDTGSEPAESYRLHLPAATANDLAGPSVEPSLVYGFGDPDNGFGGGWRLSFTSYDFATRTLRYGREQLVLDIPGEAPELRLTRTGDTLRLMHRSGLVEILSPAEGPETALVSQTHAPSGGSISYTYSDERCLNGIFDDQSSQIMRIEHGSDQVRFVYPQGATDQFTATLTLHDGLLTTATFAPGEDATWSFTYKDGQLATVREPHGYVVVYENGKRASVRLSD